MLYNSLKIIHILSATLLLTGMAAGIRMWDIKQIQTSTTLIFIPFALLQLTTGFTMISLKHYNLSDLWILGSAIGFIIVVTSWFAFIYFLLQSKQTTRPTLFFKRMQFITLATCVTAILGMVFLMANKII
jgi:uncharacterized membrane protein